MNDIEKLIQKIEHLTDIIGALAEDLCPDCGDGKVSKALSIFGKIKGVIHGGIEGAKEALENEKSGEG